MEKTNEDLKYALIHSKQKIELFTSIPKKKQGIIILALPRLTRKHILVELTTTEILSFIKFMDLDDAAAILRILEQKRSKEILKKLETDTRQKIELLLTFDINSAAGLMTLDYIQVEKEKTKISDVIAVAEKHEKKTGKYPIILITQDNALVGELPIYAISKAKKNDKIIKHYRKIPSILYNKNILDVPKLLREHSHDKVVVVDEEKSILGLIYAHDILRVLEDSDNIGKFAGVNKEEHIFDSFSSKVKNRYKWLIINLATAFLAASVVGLFNDMISKFVLLAVYMPIVAGMGGNAGTQTLAVVIRGIALKEIGFNKQAWKAIMQEVIAGAINGVLIGCITAIISYLWNKTPMLGLVIGLAMIMNLIIAAFFGSIIPLIMKKLGKDPATSATIFITTATDVFGFFMFLGLASILL